MHCHRFFRGFFVFLFITSCRPLLYAANPESPACVAEDASDRDYLEQVISLIQNAGQSVDISMFAIQFQPQPEDAGNRLVQALGAAAGSGKRVRLWLNSRQASIGTNAIFMRPDLQRELIKKGLKLFYVDKSRRLHDKLIVIDRETVVDGSMNWTREALLNNFESVSVIHSPALAAQKITRLESLPAVEQTLQDMADGLEGKTFSFPMSLLKDPKIFPASLEGSQIRTIGLYLLLLENAKTAGNTFEIELEAWGGRLPFKKQWFGPSLRHEMHRSLDFLKGYSLIQWEETEKDKARVTLLPVESPEQIRVPEMLVKGGYCKILAARELFVYLIALRKAQVSGNVPFWLGPIADVAGEFYLSTVTLIRGLWELRRQNIIEIYPSEKKLVGGVWQREFTNRYLLNPLESPEKRQSRFNALNEKFGGALVSKARGFADAIDEPEDPEVVRQFVHLLKGYPEKDVQEAVRIVAGFNRNNALRTPAYVRGILAANHDG